MPFRSRFGLMVLLAALLLLPLTSQYATTNRDLSGSAVRQEAPADDSGDTNNNEGSSDANSSESSDSDSESNNDESGGDSSDDTESSESGDTNEENEQQNAQEETTTNDNSSDNEETDDESVDSAEGESAEANTDDSSGEETNDAESSDEEGAGNESATDDESTDDESADDEVSDDENTEDEPSDGENADIEDTNSNDESSDDSSSDEDDSSGNNQPEATEEPDSSNSDSGSEVEDTAPESTEEPAPAPTTPEPAPEVTEEPDSVTTPSPESTEEPESAETPDPEATPEVEADESADLSITSVVCVPGTGVVFVITNNGGDMTDSRDYDIDDSGGSFQLDAGDHIEIEAGYGDPVLTSDEMEASLGSDCPAPGRIAGVVWNNRDGDATRAEDEPGIADVTVTLIQMDDENSEPIATETLEDGSYSFELLLDGTYQVTVDTEILPPRLLPSYDLDDTFDSQTVITIEGGAEVLADFGYTQEPPGAMSGLVWDDQNGDGLRNDDEPGMAGIQLILKQGDEEIASLTTDEAGQYAFAELIAGEYTLAVVNAPDDAQPTADSDDEPNGITVVGVRSGATTEDVNFGYLLKQPGAISGLVWADLNGDGEHNAGEPGLSAAIISLSDTEISVTSADDGTYVIDNLDEGDYTVTVDVSAWLDDYLPSASASTVVTVSASKTTEDINFSVLPRPVSLISGTVWADLNGDGLIDEDENGLSGLTINLNDGAGTTLEMTSTDETGAYSFGDLSDGLYIVSAAAVDGWLPSTEPVTAIQVEAGIDYAANFGYLPEPPASVAGVVWADLNGDGLFDEDESGLPNVEIALAETDSQSITTTTDENGAYDFSDLPAGTYILSVSAIPDDYQLTAAPESETITLAPGDTLQGLNYGYLLPPMSRISGVVWADTDGDGERNAEETGLSGITVNLLDANGDSVAQTTTGDDGTYAINDLRLGDYQLNLSDVPGGLSATYDPDGDLDSSTALSLTTDGVQADFGYQALSSSSISGLVWLETSNFGTRDNGEGGLAGAVVRLLDSDGSEINAVVIEAGGRFEFIDLEPGQYTLQVDTSTLPAKLFATYDRDGEPDFSTRISLRPGEDLRNVEFGIVGTF